MAPDAPNNTLQPGLTICVPGYNEEGAIAETVGAVLEAATVLDVDYEVIVVNDGSRDGTGAIVDGLAAANPHVVAVHQNPNQGVGAAFKLALSRARFDRITLVPGDHAYQLEGLKRLMENHRKAELLLSYRDRHNRPPLRRFLSVIFTGWLRFMTGYPIRDGHSLYVFPVERARAYMGIMPDDHRYHVVTLVCLLRRATSFVQVPVWLVPRADASSGVVRPSFLFRIGMTMLRLFVGSLSRFARRSRAVELAYEGGR